MRLFIGLPLPGNAAEDTVLLAKRAQTSIPGRYTLPSNYHITLAFLGEVPPDRLPDAAQVLDAFAARFAPPRLTLGGLSHFGRPQNAILVREAHAPALPGMHDALSLSLRARQLPCTDGPFSPHVTLARHADLRLAPPQLLHAAPVSFCAPHAVLFLSARDGENILRYTPLHSAPFASP